MSYNEDENSETTTSDEDISSAPNSDTGSADDASPEQMATFSDDSPEESTSSQGTSSQDTSSQDASSGDASSGDASSGDTSSEDTSPEATMSATSTSSEDTSSEDNASSRDTSSEDTSSDDSWFGGSATDDTSSEDSADQTASADESEDASSVDTSSSGDTSSDESENASSDDTSSGSSEGTVIDTSLGEICPEVKEGLDLSTKRITTGWGDMTLKAKAQIKIGLRHAESGNEDEGRAKAKQGLDQSQLQRELSSQLDGDFGEATSVDGKFAPVTADLQKGKLKLGSATIEVAFSNGSQASFELTGIQLSWGSGGIKAQAGVIGVKLEHEYALGTRALGDGWTATLTATVQIQIELAPDYARIARAAAGGGAFFLVVGVTTSLLVGIATVSHFVSLWKHLKEHDRVVEELNERLEAYGEGFARGLDDAIAGFAATESEYEDADLGAAWKSGYDAAARVDREVCAKFMADADVAAWIKEDSSADPRARFSALLKAQRAELIAAARSTARPAIKRSIYQHFRTAMSGNGSSARSLRDNVFQALYVPTSKYHYRTGEVDRALYLLAMADNWLYRSPDVHPIPDYDMPAAEAERRHRAVQEKLDRE